MDSLDNPQDFTVEGGSQIVIKAAGKTAHAAFPEGSDSAAVRLARVMAGAPFLTEKEQACFRFLDQGFADYYGEGMGIAFEDGLSGRLTLVGGMARTERGRFIQNFNIRYPVTAGAEALVKQMSAQAGRYGWILDWSRDNPPCVIDPESPVVKELTALCRQVLGTETKAYSMGGGTYARKLPNAVAFGPGIRGQKKPCRGGGHQPDECVKIENLTNAMVIYIEALKRLDVLIGE